MEEHYAHDEKENQYRDRNFISQKNLFYEALAQRLHLEISCHVAPEFSRLLDAYHKVSKTPTALSVNRWLSLT
jgi:hypothetical protein